MSQRRPRLAIVSSYGDLCGNATYAEALRRGFEEHVDVTMCPLDLDVLQSRDGSYRRQADEHIRELAKVLREVDMVNIQYEQGLFGCFPREIIARMRCLIEASQRLVVTLHRVNLCQASWFNRHVMSLVSRGRLRSAMRVAMDSMKQGMSARCLQHVVSLCEAHGQAGLLVHTSADRRMLSHHTDLPVVDHPITFYNPEDVAALVAASDGASPRSTLMARLGVDDASVLVGIFGFISPYKGHETAIQALRYLPERYHLVIAGGQHPQGIRMRETIDPYIKTLLKRIDQLGLAQRVHFLGDLEDDRFVQTLAACDVTVLPYVETGQSGSGIAALTLDVGKKALFSLSRPFIELNHYCSGGGVPMVTIGNALELAQKLERVDVWYEPEAISAYQQRYNLAANIDTHLRLFEQLGVST